MKTSESSDAQIMSVLQQAEGGFPVAYLCRAHGMSSARFYKWRSKYRVMDASLMVRMKELDEENTRLKKIYAETSMQNDLLKQALGKSGEVISKARDDRRGGALPICQHCVRHFLIPFTITGYCQSVRWSELVDDRTKRPAGKGGSCLVGC